MLDFFLFCWGGGRTHTTSQQDPILLLLPPSALLPLDGWGHRGRVKVTSGRRGVGLGLSEGGGGGRGRGGCIKTDRTQVVLYPPCPALGKRKPLKCSGSTSYFFFLSPPPSTHIHTTFHSGPTERVHAQDETWQHHPREEPWTGPAKCWLSLCSSSPRS